MLFAKIQEIIRLPVSTKVFGAFFLWTALKNSSVVFANGDNRNKIKLDPTTKIHCHVSVLIF